MQPVLTASLVRVLDADVGLADGLAPAARRMACHHLVTNTVYVHVGRWAPSRPAEELFGLLLLDGMLIRRVSVAGRSSVELLGQGDLIRPWPAHADGYGVAPEIAWHALTPTTLAVLDRRFVTLAARWPEILIALSDRAVRRSRSLALRLALAQAPSVVARVLVVLWHLADRWGHVTSDGTVVSVTLSQSVLAELVAARRQSVCMAVAELRRRGLIARRGDGHWVLSGTSREALALADSHGRFTAPSCPSTDGDETLDRPAADSLALSAARTA